MTNRLALASGLLLLLTASCSGSDFAIPEGEPDAESDSAAEASVDSGSSEDTTVADTSAGDTAAADTAASDTNVGDTNVGDSSSGDTAVSDTNVGDTAGGDTAVSDTGAVETGGDAGCGTFDPSSGTIWVDKGATTSGVGTAACPHKTISAAIAQAKSRSFKGTIRVRGPATGSYLYDEPDRLDVPAFVTVSGDDESKVQIVASGNCPISSSANVNCAIALAADSKLEKVTVGLASTKSFDFGVVTTFVAAGARPILGYVTVQNAKKSGMVVMNGAELHSVTSTKGTEAGVAVNTGKLFVDDSVGGRASAFTDNGTQGVFLANTATAELISVQLLRNTQEGLKAETGANSRTIVLRTSTFSQNSAAGAEINGGTITIEGGTFAANGTAGLKVSGAASINAVNADFTSNKTNGLELQSNAGFTHKLQGVVADSNVGNGVVWGNAALSITASKLRRSSFSKNGGVGIHQLSLAGFDIDSSNCDGNGSIGLRFGAGSAISGPTYSVLITGTSASNNGTTSVLGTGVWIGASARASVKIRGSKLTGNTGGGLFFDYGTLGANSLDIGTASDPGCNDFGSVKNTKTGVCLSNSGAKGSQSAEGDTWNGPLSTTDTSLWQLGMTTECYTNPYYFEVTYRKALTGADYPVAVPTIAASCGIIVTP